jgi:Zn-dependent membrane protease YugP
MKTALLVSSVLAMFLYASTGCASKHQSGVKSDYRTQWTNVAAGTDKTTAAARAVLESRNLKDVTSNATDVDGVATGKMADNTKVKVDVKKKSDSASQVSVTVGSLGDPALGAELAREIKDRAER